MHFHDIAHLLPHKCLGDGRIDGNLVFQKVHLMWADDGERLFAIGIQIGHLYLGEQTYDIRGQSIRIDDLGEPKYLLQKTNSTNQS